MADKITGYQANYSKDRTKRYVKVFVVTDVDTSYYDGAGQLTREVNCDERLEKELKTTQFPLEADLDYQLVNIRTENGSATGVTVVGIKPVRKLPTA